MAGTHHAVRVTRRELAEWFDEYYEDGEPGIGKFSWLSDHGATCFECLRNKNLIFLRHCQSTYQAKVFGAERLQQNRAYADARLTEVGKVQASGLSLSLEAFLITLFALPLLKLTKKV